MTAPLRMPAAPLPLDHAPARSDRAQLRKVAHQLEAVFLNQLFQAMRASVPQSGLGGENSGGELFTSLLDEKLAGIASERMHRGVGEALYRELSRRLPPEGVKP